VLIRIMGVMPFNRLLEVIDMLRFKRVSLSRPRLVPSLGTLPFPSANILPRMTLIVGLAATSLAGMGQVPAIAGEAAENPSLSIHVSTKGLDLSNKADLALLRHRIDHAATKVCEWVVDGDSATSPGFVDCFLRSASDARKQLDVKVAELRSKGVVANLGH
jgi:UrcA family protein